LIPEIKEMLIEAVQSRMPGFRTHKKERNDVQMIYLMSIGGEKNNRFAL